MTADLKTKREVQTYLSTDHNDRLLELLSNVITKITITEDDVVINFNRTLIIQSDNNIALNSINGNIIHLGKEIHLNPPLDLFEDVLTPDDIKLIDQLDENYILKLSQLFNKLNKLKES